MKFILDFTHSERRDRSHRVTYRTVEHDMNDDTDERTKTMHNVTNTNGEQTEIVIENENAEAEAEEVEGTSTEIMLNDDVETTGGTDEEHPELSTVNEESDHIVDEEHHARCAHTDEETDSIVSHVSSDMNEKEKDDEEADETAAAKETEEISKEDVEIRRLIEERRNTPEEENSRLKEVSKCIKNVSETKKRMKRQQDIQRIFEDFKGKKNISGVKSAHHQDNERERRNHHVSKRDYQCLFENSTKNLRRQ